MPKSARRAAVLIAIAALRWLDRGRGSRAARLGGDAGDRHLALQAKLFSRWAGGLTFGVADGAERGDPVSQGRPL